MVNSNDDRRALLEAMARGGTAGRDAYLAAQAQGQSKQHQAAVALLGTMDGNVGMTNPNQEARFLFEMGAYSNPALAEAKTAGAQWDDQVGYENIGIAKLLGDTNSQIADANRESDIGLTLNRERAELDTRLQQERDAREAQLTEQRSAAQRAAADAQAAATATTFNPQLAWDAITRREPKPPKINLSPFG